MWPEDVYYLEAEARHLERRSGNTRIDSRYCELDQETIDYYIASAHRMRSRFYARMIHQGWSAILRFGRKLFAPRRQVKLPPRAAA